MIQNMTGNGRRTLIVAGALAAGLILGTAGSLVASAVSSGDLVLPASGAYTGDGKFPTNDKGQTYGTAIGASSAETEPDLILATGRDSAGRFVDGYALKTDLEAPMKDGETRTIPLYSTDGETVVGEFTMGSGSASNEPGQ